MVVPQDGQRRRRALRKLFAGRGRSILKRAGVETKSAESSQESVVKPSRNKPSPPPPPTTAKTQAVVVSKQSSSGGFRSLRLLENSRSDIEIKLSNLELEERDGDESTDNKSLRNEPEDDSVRHVEKAPSVWKKALSHVEFQDDNNQVFLLDGSQDNAEDDNCSQGVRYDVPGDVQDQEPQTEVQVPEKFVEIDSTQAQDSFFFSHVRIRSETSVGDNVSKSPSEKENQSQATDWQTVQHSVQNETMSQVSALTHKGSKSTAYSESASETSFAESFSSAIYPDVLMVRTKTEGTKDTNKTDTISEIEEDEEEESENNDKTESDTESDESNKQREDADSESESGSEEGEEDDDDSLFDGETDFDDDDEESSMANSSFCSLDEKSEERDATTPTGEVTTKTTLDSEDAFVDIPEPISEGESLDADDESAYTHDDNNVPFVDPIECEMKEPKMKDEPVIFVESDPAKVTDEERRAGWKLFGMLSYN